MKEIEIPFGAKDSELKGWEYTIPEGMEAEIKDGKIVVREKKPELTEFEEGVRQVIVSALSGETPNGSGGTMSWAVALSDDDVRRLAPRLLKLAKKELLGQWNENMKDEYARGKRDGLTIGYNKAMKEYNESVAYHYPTYGPPCHYGGICTNPLKDCINCPGTTGGINISTTSGTCKKD